MKHKYFILLLQVLLTFSLNAQQKSADSNYYYHKGKKIYLTIDYSRMSVISEGEIRSNEVNKILDRTDFEVVIGAKCYTRRHIVTFEEYSEKEHNKENFIAEMVFFESLTRTDYFNIIQRLSIVENIIKVAPAYIVSSQKLGISNNFYVKLFKKEDLNKLFDLAEEYSIQVLGYNKFMPLWVTLSCGRGTSLNAMEAAKLFYETALFEKTEPELLFDVILTSNDPLFPNQWNLKNTGQHGPSGIDIKAEQAWEFSTGSNVIVAVLDNGLDLDHPDLVNNIFGPGYNTYTNSDTVPVGEHGTKSAGRNRCSTK